MIGKWSELRRGARPGYCKFPQKRWIRVQASSSALVAVA